MPTNALENPLVIPVLGLLAESPQHVYQMTTTLSTERGVTTTRATVQSLLGAMVRAEWVAVLRTEQAGNRPARTIFQITPIGWRALSERVDVAIRNPDVPLTPFLAALGYLGALQPNEAIDALRDRIDHIEAQLSRMEDRYRAARDEGRVARLHLIETEFAAFQMRNEIAWLSSIVGEIESGILTWPREPEKEISQ
ncbi:MAG TPA: helix-turn-helix transcriptional regulator [Thermomicrobiales bacterium]|nr:helix-turn-helix transcriptional regulator [Thermomicrobiales bacterium]